MSRDWIDALLDPYGCLSRSCVIRNPSGQATNGGCHCDDRAVRVAFRKLKWAIRDQDKTVTPAPDAKETP